MEWSGVIPPTVSILCKLQTGGGGLREYSAAEDVTSESVPDSGIAGNWRHWENLVNGGNVDLGLVVRGDQDGCKDNISICKNRFMVKKPW